MMKTVKVVLLTLLVVLVAGKTFVFAQMGPNGMDDSHGMHERGTGGFIGRYMDQNVTDVVASELGLTPMLLQDALRTGASLEELTLEADLTVDDVVTALVSERQAAVDAAVANGALSEERAVTMMGTYEARTRAAFTGDSVMLPWMQAGRVDHDRPGYDDDRYDNDRNDNDRYDDDRDDNDWDDD